MYEKIIRIVAGLFGAAFLFTGLSWQLDPAGAAESLHMPLLEAAGRSTQVGDMTSFFITGGLLALAGVFTRNHSLMLAPALLVGLAATFRTLAWLMHDAALVVDLIAVEVVMCIAFLLAWARMKSPA